MKQEYTPPAVEELGTLSDLTLAGANGERLDMTFSAGTSRGDITFS